MKHLLIFSILLMGIFTACSKSTDSTSSVEPTKKELISRNWKAQQVTANGTNNPLKVGEKWNFLTSGNYTTIDPSGTMSNLGTWALQTNDAEILFDKGQVEQRVATILQIDKTRFRFRVPESGTIVEYSFVPN